MKQLLTVLLVLTLLTGVVWASECVHEYEQIIDIPPTCETGGSCYWKCGLCGNVTAAQYVPPLGHSYGDWYIVTYPTCTQEGLQARDCSVCDDHDTAPIPKQDHNYVEEVIEPTCTARGYTKYYCTGCTRQTTYDYVPALGHDYDIVLLKEPTDTAMGRVRFNCSRCRETHQMYYKFRDLSPDSYCFDPVMWALDQGVTAGIDETHFAPEQSCNRAQVVTFLWRSAGKPEPQGIENPFADVPSGSFYEDAVLWAYETGITTGTDAAHFSPETVCSRAQVVTFLHRLHGCPEPEGGTSFPDVSPGSFYHKAVLWAAQRDITRGMENGLFCPSETCNRAQIVTFLYRDAKNP